MPGGAAIALSAGFGGGAFLVGFMAQWLPAPKVLPYVVHIALTVAVGVLVWNAPEPGGRRAEWSGGVSRGAVVGQHYALSGHFWTRIGPMAPWVFACPAISMVILPTLIKEQISGGAIAFTGLICGITLGTGVLVQRPARRLETRRPGVVTALGMVATLVGVLLTVLIVGHRSVALVVVASVVLGVGYGLNLVGGLTRIEHASPATDLAMTNAVFYSLTYVGFAVPTVVSMLVGHWPETTVLLGFAVLALLSLVVGTLAQRAARPAAV